MTWIEAVCIVFAGFWAGTINTVVGSGTLVTFPTLLFFGYPPVAANVTNSVGLFVSGVTAAAGYREELRAVRPLVSKLVPIGAAGSVVGSLLLLVLPSAAFKAIVPVLIIMALLLVVFGGRLQRWARSKHTDGVVPRSHEVTLLGGTFFGGVYGGYFGAAQGVLMMGLMNAILDRPLQQLNALKNVIVPVANLVAAIVFVIVAPSQIHWGAAGLLAVGALIGGWVGARVGRRLSPAALRTVIVVVGVIAVVKLIFFP